ncbi:hypothetical protein [Clostridium estertheticum]|nr:hypothetical protein [Clostridium estertheticum]
MYTIRIFLFFTTTEVTRIVPFTDVIKNIIAKVIIEIVQIPAIT